MTGPLMLTLALASLGLQTPPEASPQETFQTLAGDFIAFHLYFNPVVASALGATGYDNRLPDLGRAALQARSEAYQSWLDRLAAIDRSALRGDAAVDYILLERGIRAELLDLEEIRSWERDPAYYVDLLDRAVVPLVRGGRGDARQRMNDLTSRLRQATTVLAEARTNLSNPPALFTSRAAEGAAGLAAVLRTEALAAFDSLDPGPGKEDFLRAAEQTANDLDGFVTFLRQNLLPRSGGEVALGSTRIGWILLHREHVTEDVEAVLTLLESEILTGRARLQDAARSLDGSRRTAEVVADVATRSLPVAEAERTAAATLGTARRSMFRSLFLTIPSDRTQVPSVRDARSPWELSMSRAPGPLSLDDGPGELTLLNPVGRMGVGPGHGTAGALVLEEGFPGHFVASMYARRAPTRLRKVFRSASLTGGWGLYAAEALVRGGFEEGPDDLAVAVLARWVQALAEARAAILVHGRRQALDVITDQLAHDAYLTPAEARASAHRAAHRPLERGALGALQLIRLRDDFLARGTESSQRPTQRRFHDSFLASGLPPSLARVVLISPDSGGALR